MTRVRKHAPPAGDAPLTATPRRSRARKGLPPAEVLAQERPPVEEAPDAIRVPGQLSPVVVATADAPLMRMLSFGLDQIGLPYQTFDSGSTVLDALLTTPTGAHPTLVVLDADLPGMDGQAILERLHTARPNAYLVVVVSAHADESVQVRSLLSGALDHLAKPFNVRVLLVKLQRWVGVARRCGVAA
jgi:CheY-like chemotaxis protein